ncbi:MAG: hypothetical protein ABI606_16790 [Rhodoferax sp.]
MKIIISRKGFDSGYGGVPSPIFPDGRIVSLPIPSKAGVNAAKGRTDDLSLGDVIANLTGDRLDGNTLIHVDPDLERSTFSRSPGWRASFGQVGSAQSHLANQGVGVGDLFLFFGWFRPVELNQGCWRYVAGSKSFHSLFGWLRVAEVICVDEKELQNFPNWLADHPHVAHADRFIGKNNTLYVAGDGRRLENSVVELPDAGMFKQWSPSLKLSAEGKSKSVWNVPTWLEPTQGRPPLTYHSNNDRWTRDGNALNLATVAKGQEFVLDASYYPEAFPWALQLIQEHA